jgi:flagellar basal-body rod modification protein FlgD
MSYISTVSSSSSTSDSSNSSTSAYNLDIEDFLNLLITELEYQDPLEPTTNTEFIADMAQFTRSKR